MPEILGRRERLDYALTMTRSSLRGGPRHVWRYGGTGGLVQATVAADPLWTRLRRAPGTFRAALAAIGEERQRRMAGEA